MDAGQIVVRLLADAKGVIAGASQGTAALRGYAASAKSIGQNMVAVGRGMTKYITLPILALGAAAAKLSLDFQKPMTDIEALVGMTAKQVAKVKREILAMAPDVARSPQELAEAYYFIASSGLKGASAMKALRASAIASAAGLGETKVIADAVTSAINAYGEENLSATKAVDILTAAVREGKAEPDQFAGAIGRVIPVAQAMGVSFGEVAGTMAALSLNGTDANEAVTQITAGLSAAIKPTKQGVEALKSVDMTYADLRKQIADKGLITVFNELSQAFGGNVEQVGKVFGNVRALRGEMTLTGPSAKKYAKIVREVAGASGDAARAAAIALEKPGAKLQRAWVAIQASLIKAGDIIVPVLAKVAGHLGNEIRQRAGGRQFLAHFKMRAQPVAKPVEPQRQLVAGPRFPGFKHKPRLFPSAGRFSRQDKPATFRLWLRNPEAEMPLAGSPDGNLFLGHHGVLGIQKLEAGDARNVCRHLQQPPGLPMAVNQPVPCPSTDGAFSAVF